MSAWPAARAQACSCAELPPPAQAANGATVVFEGRVLSIAPAADPNADRSVTLHVVRSFKGAERERLELRTSAHGASCGFPFQVDQSYLVYAVGEPGALRANLCSRTRPMADAGEDLLMLGMGATPVDPTGPSAMPDAPAKPPPAQGGCASCSVGSTRSRAAASWPAWLVLCGWLVRRRLHS